MSKKILVVDDILEYLDIIEITFEDFDVIKAKSLEEAKSLLVASLPDAVIIDVRLDDKDENNRDGLKLLKWIKSKFPDIPVIMISAYKEFEYKAVSFQLGADRFIKKPINPEMLRNSLLELIG